jgi:hypothetical protein
VLGIVGTLVAIVTGMVALAGKVGSGHDAAAEASLPEYQQSIGEVCTAINGHEEDRAEEAKRLARRVARAKTTMAQRDAVQDATQKAVRNSEHDLAMLQGLNPPRSLVATAGRATAAWTRTLDRLRAYAHGLDVATSPAAVFAAVGRLAAARPAQQRDATAQRAALLKLGGGRCQLDEQPASGAVRVTWIGADGAEATKVSSRRGGGRATTTSDGGSGSPAGSTQHEGEDAGSAPAVAASDGGTDAPKRSADVSPTIRGPRSTPDASPGAGPESGSSDPADGPTSPDASPEQPVPPARTPNPPSDPATASPGDGGAPGG